MSKQRVIRLFEHDTLRVGQVYAGVPFSREKFDALTLFNEKGGRGLFTVVHKGIKFSHYVGVIKVGGLVIEILPKVDSVLSRNSSAKVRRGYQRILLEMLQRSGMACFADISSAELNLREFTLLDLYVLKFLEEVRTLIHRGLTKKYSLREENLKTLTGQLHISKDILRNSVHRERFFVRHQCYDNDHLLNQIIRKALNILNGSVQGRALFDAVRRTLMEFPEVGDPAVTKKIFDSLSFSRKTECYKPAVQLAKLIILGHCPDLASGNQQIVSFLFDMNELWERYVYYELKRRERELDYYGARARRLFSKPSDLKNFVLIRVHSLCLSCNL